MLKKGFTLAEILITLSIIGIVAAFTIPTLLNVTNVEKFRPMLKKQYSVLTDAVSKLETLNGAIDVSSDASLVNDLATQISVLKTGTWSTLTTLPSNFNYKCYKNTSGTCGNWLKRPDNDDKAAFLTKDGVLYIIRIYATNCDGNNYHAKINSAETLPIPDLCAMIEVDLNGDKSPNMLGVDLHTLYLLKQNGYYYVRASGSNYAYDCSKDYPDNYNNSLHCTNRMLQDMDMP